MFDPDLHQATLARHQLERDLRDAVKQDELFLLYQPVVHLAHNDMVGVEALIRWEHPTRGVISPVEFIPLAEANGSINTIGDWVLERAIHQLLEWDDAQPDRRLSISVNVSPLQLADPDFVGRVARILLQSQIAPKANCCRPCGIRSDLEDPGHARHGFFEKRHPLHPDLIGINGRTRDVAAWM